MALAVRGAGHGGVRMKLLASRCPLCGEWRKSRAELYVHLMAAHGGAEQGSVSPLPPTDLELEAAGQLNVLGAA